MIERNVEDYVIEFEPTGEARGKLWVREDGEPLHVDKLNLTSSRRREEYLNQLPKEAREAVSGKLLELADQAPKPEGSQSGAEVLSENATRPVHPAFEVGEDFLLYGWRVEKVTPSGEVESVPVRALSAYDDGIDLRVVTEDRFEVHGQEYVAHSRGTGPLLADRWGRDGLRELIVERTRDPATPASCYKRVHSVLHRHIDFPDEGAYPILAAYVLLTYVSRFFPALPYVALVGPKGTGKSQTLDVLERLCFNAYKGRITAAGLGDTTDALRGTVLIDQAHKLSDELVDLLVDGYRRDGGRRRVVDMDNRGDPHEFETFGPKAFASWGSMDEDLQDRLIMIHTAPADREVNPLPASGDEFTEIRGMLYSSSLAQWPRYRERASAFEAESLDSRAEELWRPIRAVLEIAEVSSEDWEAARELYRRSATETVAELGDWELALFDELDERLTEAGEATELRNDQLVQGVRKRLGMDDPDHNGPHPTKKWLGEQLNRLNLVEDSDRRQVDGQRYRFYRIDPDRVEAQRRRFDLPAASQDTGPSLPWESGSGSQEDRPGGEPDASSRLPDSAEGRATDTGNDSSPEERSEPADPEIVKDQRDLGEIKNPEDLVGEDQEEARF